MEPQPRSPYLIPILAALVLIGAGFVINASSRDALGQVSSPGAVPASSGQGAVVYLGNIILPSESGSAAVMSVGYQQKPAPQLVAVDQGTGGTVTFPVDRSGSGFRTIGANHAAAYKLYDRNRVVVFWAYAKNGASYPVTNVAVTAGNVKFNVTVAGTTFAVTVSKRSGAVRATPVGGGPALTGRWRDGYGVIFAGSSAYLISMPGTSPPSDVPAPAPPVSVEGLTLNPSPYANSIVATGSGSF